MSKTEGCLNRVGKSQSGYGRRRKMPDKRPVCPAAVGHTDTGLPQAILGKRRPGSLVRSPRRTTVARALPHRSSAGTRGQGVALPNVLMKPDLAYRRL